MTISLYCHNFDNIKRWQTVPQTCVSETKASVAETLLKCRTKLCRTVAGELQCEDVNLFSLLTSAYKVTSICSNRFGINQLPRAPGP